MITVLHVLGIDSTTSNWYAFWSGIAGDVSSFALLAGVWGLFRKHNCHVKNCHRIGRFTVPNENGGYLVCAKHHPTGAPSAAEITEVTDGR